MRAAALAGAGRFLAETLAVGVAERAGVAEPRRAGNVSDGAVVPAGVLEPQPGKLEAFLPDQRRRRRPDALEPRLDLAQRPAQLCGDRRAGQRDVMSVRAHETTDGSGQVVLALVRRRQQRPAVSEAQ